jgi:crotonobetainyl-CoA:carnitine CoA-transferase CaiB-like acyl-CoA transferase
MAFCEHRGRAATNSADGAADTDDRLPRQRTGPLAGVTVTDFCWMGVGSLATRLLADFGARVIRIENRNRLDMPRRLPIYKNAGLVSYGEESASPDPNLAGCFNNYNRNKLAITLNMSVPEGRALAERLIRISSLLTENFAPGVMEGWGLTESHVHELQPEIIYARMSGFGHDGPYSRYRGYGPVVQAFCGLSHISGLPGREPSGWGLSYMDNMAAYYNSIGILMALFARNRTGRGTDVDVAAVEVGIELLGPTLLDVTVNKRSTRHPDFPPGNRLAHPLAAPHGVYPSKGSDQWVAIAVFTDEEWSALARALGEPEWTKRPVFATLASRVEHADELDAMLSNWTRNHTKYEAMEILQRAGIPAGAVQDAEDVNERDPQMAARGIFFEMDHPVIGAARFEGVPIRASDFEPDNWRSGPLLGEDNAFVYGQLLGLSAEQITDLAQRGVI